MIMNEIDYSGKLVGHQVKLGYYVKSSRFLDNEKTILETVEESIDIGTNKNQDQYWVLYFLMKMLIKRLGFVWRKRARVALLNYY